MSKSLQTPVAFLIFNRPALTERVFSAIAEAKPQRLLIVADGPRTSEEVETCNQARAIIEKVDWDCRVQTNFADTNLGCRVRVSSGIEWIFSEVSEAIILEDDCLPHPSFFDFCQQLLERYRDDERVMHIGGGNFQNGNNQTPFSYYFSRYLHVWGWATWRRAWQFYDVSMSSWPATKTAFLNMFDDDVERNFWQEAMEQIFAQEICTWDYQWSYACLRQSGLSIVPAVNLISNLGWDADSTHNKTVNSEFAFKSTADIGSLRHPPYVMPHRAADRYVFDRVFGGAARREQLQQKAESMVRSDKFSAVTHLMARIHHRTKK